VIIVHGLRSVDVVYQTLYTCIATTGAHLSNKLCRFSTEVRTH